MNNFKINKHSNLALSINDFMEYNSLYEGLIYTYSVKDTCSFLSKIITSLNIKYTLLRSENNATPYIQIEFNNIPSNLNIETVNKLMNTCGWNIGDIITVEGKSYHKDIEISNILKINNIKYLVYRAKHEIEINQKQWSKYLYHISPIKNLEKIKKVGLVPKNQNKLIKHESHIYLYDLSKNNFTIEELVSEIHNNRFKTLSILDKENEYVIFKIDMEWLKNYKLFLDPDLEDSYFMVNNIHPNCMELIKTIKL